MKLLSFFVVSGFLIPCNLFAESYRIEVRRQTADSGKLTFFIDGTKKLETQCWWRAKDPIPAKTYTGCSTTIMEEKRLKAVFLPNDQTGRVGIFIHAGSKPEHSEGCIVCSREVVEKIFDIVPNDKKQMTVEVVDEKAE